MKMLKIICLLIFLSALSVSVQTVVTGKVVDDHEESLSSVIIKRYTQGYKLGGYASSISDGSFSIKAEAGDSLIFSMLGFKTQRIAVSSNMKPLTIRMSDGAIRLRKIKVKVEVQVTYEGQADDSKVLDYPFSKRDCKLVKIVNDNFFIAENISSSNMQKVQNGIN